MSSFLGIARDPHFSPGKVDADRQILEMAAQNLRDAGHRVTVITETDRDWPLPDEHTVVFTMSQGAAALRRLEEWEGRGVRVVNRPQAILNCQRDRTVALLSDSAVTFPCTVTLENLEDPDLPEWVETGGAWIKRGDVHAVETDDVVRVHDHADARAALSRMHRRGIVRAAVQQHVAGLVVKFYGTRNGFFYALPMQSDATVAPDVAGEIDRIGRRAADLLGVEVYGGDCIVGARGAATLIDLNDWPSYSACRLGASKSIAAYLQETLRT